MFTPALYYDAGQIATAVLETDYRDGYGIPLDPISPVVAGVFDPNLAAISGFPQDMTRLGILDGVFLAKFYLPNGLTAVGTYLCLVRWVNPITMYSEKRVYPIIVGVPFGNASAVGV
jgi:hypothetical protein